MSVSNSSSHANAFENLLKHYEKNKKINKNKIIK